MEKANREASPSEEEMTSFLCKELGVWGLQAWGW